MHINHLSVSRVGVWQECQLKYKYQYHMKVPPIGEEPIYFAYGSLIHKIAQEYVASAGTKMISEVAHDLFSGKIPYEKGKKPQVPTEYKKKFPEHLEAITKLTHRTGFGGELEYNFRYDLDPPHGRHVIGFIDRLIIRDNKFWILDYKTTKKGWWRTGAKDIVGDLQLRCYARVVQQKFGAKAENIHAALYYLEGEELIGAKFSEETLEKTEKDLLAVYLEIQNTTPDEAHGRVGKHCARCDYRTICPLYSVV